MVTTGNGLCSLTVTAVCRIGWSLLATGRGGFPLPEGGTGERARSEIERFRTTYWCFTAKYLKHGLLFEATETSRIIALIN